MSTYDEGFDAKGKFSEVMLSSWRLFPLTPDLQARGIFNWWCVPGGTRGDCAPHLRKLVPEHAAREG